MDNSRQEKNPEVETESVEVTSGGRSEENERTIRKLHCLKKAKHHKGE